MGAQQLAAHRGQRARGAAAHLARIRLDVGENVAPWSSARRTDARSAPSRRLSRWITGARSRNGSIARLHIERIGDHARHDEEQRVAVRPPTWRRRRARCFRRAPGWFSTMFGWPVRSARPAATMRVDDVGRPARRERHQPADRLRRPGRFLRRCNCGNDDRKEESRDLKRSSHRVTWYRPSLSRESPPEARKASSSRTISRPSRLPTRGHQLGEELRPVGERGLDAMRSARRRSAAARGTRVSSAARADRQVRSKPALAPVRCAAERGVERHRAEAARDHQIAVGLEARGERPVHLLVGEDVDVGIDHEHVLDVGQRSRTPPRWRCAPRPARAGAARCARCTCRRSKASRRPRPARAPRFRARARPSTSVRSA